MNANALKTIIKVAHMTFQSFTRSSKPLCNKNKKILSLYLLTRELD